jgi:beta-galactosidase
MRTGWWYLLDTSELKITVLGPATLLAAGNADPQHQGSFTDDVFHLFRGRALVILRSTGKPGNIVVEVTSRELKPDSLTLYAY